jgi:sugar phosphate permease
MASTIAATKTESKIFYGWWIVVISTIALIVNNGLAIGGLPVFYKPMLNELIASGVTTPALAPKIIGNAATMTFLVAGAFSPLTGILIRRMSLRILMTIGCFLLGGGLILYSRATKPSDIYLAHFLLGSSLACAGVAINAVLVSNWFRRLRGTAIGIAMTGTSLGGALIPLVATPLIANYGWRTALLYVSGLVWLVLLPAIWLFVRVRPEDKGLLPDGDTVAPQSAAGASQAALTGLTLAQALRTPVFWVLSLAAALLFYPIFTTSQQFILYLQTPRIGMAAATANKVQSALFLSSLFGKFFFGWLSDRLKPVHVMLLCCVVMLGGALFLLSLNQTTAFAFIVPFGMGYGGAFVLLQLLSVTIFGARDSGAILGAIIFIEALGGAIGSYLTGILASNAGGDYTLAFYCVIGVTALALLAVLVLSRLPKPQQA